MYAVDSVLPTATLPPGTNVLVTGTDPAACTEVTDRLLTAGLADGEPAVVASTGETPTAVRERIEVDEYDAPIAVVSSARDQDRSADDLTRCVSSPTDFRSLGMACSELLDRVASDGDVRVSIDSVSDLLSVADVNTVFRFLQVLTGRIASAGGFGVATLRTDRHDERTCNTIGQLFDVRIELRRRSKTRELRMRGRGIEGVREEWVEF